MDLSDPSIEKLTGPMCPSVVPRINGVEGPVTSDQRQIRNGAVESDDCEKMNASAHGICCKVSLTRIC